VPAVRAPKQHPGALVAEVVFNVDDVPLEPGGDRLLNPGHSLRGLKSLGLRDGQGTSGPGYQQTNGIHELEHHSLLVVEIQEQDHSEHNHHGPQEQNSQATHYESLHRFVDELYKDLQSSNSEI
jgi:hypothetical protein